MWPFVAIFFCLGVALLLIGRKLEGDAERAAKWPTVVGQLESCEVVNVPGIAIEDPSTWELRLRYSYAVHGKTYHSTRYAFGYGDGSDDARHRRIADSLKSSPQLLVRYDPLKPSEAVISIEPQPNATNMGCTMLVVTAIAALLAGVVVVCR